MFSTLLGEYFPVWRIFSDRLNFEITKWRFWSPGIFCFAWHLYTCEFVSFIDYAVCRSSIPVSNVTQNSKGTCCLRFFWWSAENSRLCMFRMCFVIMCIVSDLMSLRRLPVLQHFGLFHGNSRSVPVLCVGGELRAARWSLMCWPSEEHKKS